MTRSGWVFAEPLTRQSPFRRSAEIHQKQTLRHLLLRHTCSSFVVRHLTSRCCKIRLERQLQLLGCSRCPGSVTSETRLRRRRRPKALSLTHQRAGTRWSAGSPPRASTRARNGGTSRDGGGASRSSPGGSQGCWRRAFFFGPRTRPLLVLRLIFSLLFCCCQRQGPKRKREAASCPPFSALLTQARRWTVREPLRGVS